MTTLRASSRPPPNSTSRRPELEARRRRPSPQGSRLSGFASSLGSSATSSTRRRTATTRFFAPWRSFAALPAGEFEAKAAEVCSKLTNEPDPAKPIALAVFEVFEGDTPKSLVEVARRYGVLLQKAVKANDSDETLKPIRDRIAADEGLLTISPERLAESSTGPKRTISRRSRRRLVSWTSPIRARRPERWSSTTLQPDQPPRLHPRQPRSTRQGHPSEVPPGPFAGAARPSPSPKGVAGSNSRRPITSPDNPLTARVMVNRIWHHHFGLGIVATPSDFGVRGEPPTHPELLDFLAKRFIESGWSVKAVHRLILLSSTYQQKSDRRDDGFEADPRNQLLWRQNRRRLDFEATRDAVLAVAGKLDLRMGGRPVELFEAKSVSTRRTVYGYIDRYDLDATFRTFDFPSPDISNPMRPVTTVPQQSLFMMNSLFVVDHARALANRPDLPPANEVEARIARLYLDLFGRTAEPNEVEAGRRFLETVPRPEGDKSPSPWEEYAQVLMMTNEFVFVD